VASSAAVASTWIRCRNLVREVSVGAAESGRHVKSGSAADDDRGHTRNVYAFDHVRNKAAAAHEGLEIQIPVDARDAGGCLADEPIDEVWLAIQAVEVVQKHEPTAWTAHAHHLPRDGHRIRDDIDEVGGVDRVEPFSGERQPRGIHAAEGHTGGGPTTETRMGPRDHRRGQIDRHDAAAGRVVPEAEASTDTDFENGIPRLRRKTLHRPVPARLEYRSIDDVVDGSEAVVDEFDGR